MARRLARSDQTGMTWPTVSGTAGELIALLDAVLVNGSNTVSVTSITRSGSTATVTTSGSHGVTAVDPSTLVPTPPAMRRVLIAGAGQAEYNGEFVATYVSSTVFTIQVTGSPATPATGSITARRAPAGWTIEFTATNKRVYRPPSGNRHFLRITDDGTGAACYARARWYSTMSDIDTGTDPTPTDTQLSGGMLINKSDGNNSTQRAFAVYSTETSVLIMIDARGFGIGSSAAFHSGFFGELVSYRAGDAFHTAVIAETSGGAASVTNDQNRIINNTTNFSASAMAGHYLMRSYTQLGASVGIIKAVFPTGQATIGGSGNGVFTFSSPMDGSVALSPIYCSDTAGGNLGVRGHIPNVWAPLHNKGPAHYDCWQGTGLLADKMFMAVNQNGLNGSVQGQLVIEVQE